LVVGVCEIDVSSLQSVVGAKGHAVRTVTWYGDELWGWGASGRAGTEPPDSIEAWLADEVDGTVAGVEQLDLNEGDKTGQAGEEATDSPDEDEEEGDQKNWTTQGTKIVTNKALLIIHSGR
jgi:translation initiation factor 2D